MGVRSIVRKKEVGQYFQESMNLASIKSAISHSNQTVIGSKDKVNNEGSNIFSNVTEFYKKWDDHNN